MMIDEQFDPDDYGWFEDVEINSALRHNPSSVSSQHTLYKTLSLPPSVTEPPSYIIDSNLNTQQLWYTTAGQRPKQPTLERKQFEKIWRDNFKSSSVPDISAFVNLDCEKPCDIIPKSEFNAEIIFNGNSPFSNSVSKSFFEEQIASLTIQVPQYRVMRAADGVHHAEFLVLVSLGNHGSITFGIWKRHSQFSSLAKLICNNEPSLCKRSVTLVSAESASLDHKQFKNTALSWQCVLQRKKWFKCLDKDYLSLKCFLLERFMHDLLFESQSSAIITRFLGLEDAAATSTDNDTTTDAASVPKKTHI